MFADIWDYSDVKGEAVPSFAILTDEPNELVAPYHDRMPVVLGDLERWLKPRHHAPPCGVPRSVGKSRPSP